MSIVFGMDADGRDELEAIDGYWHARARAEAARATKLEEDMARFVRRFAEARGANAVIEAPAYVPVLLRDLSALAADPGSFSVAEREWLSRVARNAAAMLDRHRTTNIEDRYHEGEG